MYEGLTSYFSFRFFSHDRLRLGAESVGALGLEPLLPAAFKYPCICINMYYMHDVTSFHIAWDFMPPPGLELSVRLIGAYLWCVVPLTAHQRRCIWVCIGRRMIL